MRTAACLASTSERVNVDKVHAMKLRPLAQSLRSWHKATIDGAIQMTASKRERLPLPRSLEDFLDPRRAALVMWDMQKGLAGRAPNVASIRDNALKLLEIAERKAMAVIWSRHILPPIEFTTGPFLLFLMKKPQQACDVLGGATA
jgi:hypothetical protein